MELITLHVAPHISFHGDIKYYSPQVEKSSEKARALRRERRGESENEHGPKT
jgi:hypothetical protein